MNDHDLNRTRVLTSQDSSTASTEPENRCQTSFVSDLPASADAFETNQAYRRIVNAIADIVGPGTPTEGMAIGVEGSWGAGKTTIINLLRERIRKVNESDSGPSGETQLITFDAWAHEGDPLRLAFMDTLTTQLTDVGWIDPGKWRERLDIVARRREVRNTFRDFRPTILDFLSAFLFFLIPVGVPLFNSALRKGITLDRTEPIAWELILGIFCFIAAPVVILSRLLIIRVRARSNSSGSGSRDGEFTVQRQSLLTLLLTRTLSDDRTVIMRTPEPSSFEFEKEFSDLMCDALNQQPERRAVLVIDNLDRVQTKEAHAVWSTLQTFLQYRHHDPLSWLRRLYTIILYDPARVAPIPEKEQLSNTNTNPNALFIQPTVLSDDEGGIEGSFLDKTIQVRFEVPAPVLSDWHEYLLDLLKGALPNHQAADHHQVYRVMAVHMLRQKRLPTIRELKLYVNQICAFHLQWQDTFPLTHVAYYVLLKRRGAAITAGLLEGKFPDPHYRGIIGEDVRSTIAALLFNVEPHIAYQLLLASPIQAAFVERDGAELEKLATNFKDGFWEVIENVVSFEWAGRECEKVASAVLALEQSGLLRTTQRDESRTVVRTLCGIATSVAAWKPFNESVASSISIVLKWNETNGRRHDERRQDAERMMISVASGLFDTFQVKAIVDVAEWLRGLDVVVQVNESLGFADLGPDSVVESIRSRLENCDHHVEPEEISRLFEVLIELNTNGGSSNALEALAREGQVLHYFFQSYAGTKAVTAASWCIFSWLCFASSFDAPPSTGNASHGYNALLELFKKPDQVEVVEFAKLMVRYKDHFSLTTMRRCEAAEQFLVACLKHIGQEAWADSFFTGTLFLQNWPFLRGEISAWEKESHAFSEVLARLSEDDDFLNEIHSPGFISSNAGLYRLLVNKSESHVLRDWCKSNLEGMSAADWQIDIEGEHEFVLLAIVVREAGAQLNLGDAFEDAIVANAERGITRDADKGFSFLFDMSFVLKPLSPERELSICAKVYDTVKRVQGDVPSGFFPSYGKFITETAKGDQEALLQIFIPLIQKRDEGGLKWLSELFRQTPALLDTYPAQAPVKNFKKSVMVALAQPADQATPVIAELARAIGLRKLDLPPLPWTVETLGEELYKFIAREGGYFDPDREPPTYRPALGALGPMNGEAEDSTDEGDGAHFS